MSEANVSSKLVRRPAAEPVPLIVIPCLNEAEHIASTMEGMEREQSILGGMIAVVDGGSTDRTVEIAAGFAARNPKIKVLHNHARIQSAAINLAVEYFGEAADVLIRVDAHCRYPERYCANLIDEANKVGAASIVVSMDAEGSRFLQKINAAAQNSPVGNGGSKHRMQPRGEFVEHGHHALIDISVFVALGGYDTRFTHNEDAEFDYRLRQAGHKIWLTAKSVVTYFPRTSVRTLCRQYFNYGRGRAQNLLKHRVLPKLRQAKVILVLPAVTMLAATPWAWGFAIPAALWAAYCFVMGLRIAADRGEPGFTLVGASAMLMHLSWSLGFWTKVLAASTAPRAEAAI